MDELAEATYDEQRRARGERCRREMPRELPEADDEGEAQED